MDDKKMEITKETTLEELMKTAGMEEILTKHGVPCVTCPMAQMEMQFLKIGDVCEKYGIDVDKLLADLNEKAK